MQVGTSRLGGSWEELTNALEGGVVPRLWCKRDDQLVTAQAAQMLDHGVCLVLHMHKLP